MSSASKAPRRLLLIINRFASDGGAESQLEQLAAGLARSGHDVTVCCINRADRDLSSLEAQGVNVRELHAESRLGRIAAIPALVKLAREAEVVQCTMWDASLWGRIAAILARRPVVVADHAADRSVQVSAKGEPRGRWIALHNRLLDRFTYATVSCATSQTALLESEGVESSRIVHIPNGIPVAATAAATGATREELGIPAGALVVMQVGVFRPEKEQMGALKAMAAVRRRVDRLHLVFVGDGPLRATVEEEARRENLDWVHFLGFRSDVPELLHLADLMLLPSRSEAMPMSVLEAMAVGVPVVATDVGDVRRTLGGGGICVPVGDARALEEAAENLLLDGELREEMGQLARRNAGDFDSAVMVERYSELLQQAR
ncbi:MAG TPA: glycosyltransferase [Solirubrobacterales bacterium]|nr:glycosyltransferase [Solirubrobacterales bacterium]